MGWCFQTFVLLFVSPHPHFPAIPHGMWDLSSPTRDQTRAPALEGKVLTSGPSGKPWDFLFWRDNGSWAWKRRKVTGRRPRRTECPALPTSFPVWCSLSLHSHQKCQELKWRIRTEFPHRTYVFNSLLWLPPKLLTSLSFHRLRFPAWLQSTCSVTSQRVLPLELCLARWQLKPWRQAGRLATEREGGSTHRRAYRAVFVSGGGCGWFSSW